MEIKYFSKNYESYIKEKEYLKGKLNFQLKQFEKCKGWADFGNWLYTIEELLRGHPTPFIPEKEILAQRLAQCLNPSLPSGIHQSALKIYKIIFENYKLVINVHKQKDSYQKYMASNMSIYSIGLFPFFQFSSPQLKPEILNIFSEYYYILGMELIPCLPALIVTILPGLDEPNEELQKTVQLSLNCLCQQVGDKYFFGSIWLSILRVPRIRNQAIKQLLKRLKQSDNGVNINDIIVPEQLADLEDDIQDLKNNLFSKILSQKALRSGVYYPQGGLIINSLLASLQDPNQLVKKNILDLILQNFKINSNVLSENDKLILVQGCLILYEKREHSLQRRTDSWLFSEDQEEGLEQDTPQKVIDYIIKAYIQIINNCYCYNEQEDDLLSPIKILKNFYLSNESVVVDTIDRVCCDLLKYIKFNQSNSGIIKASERLFESVASHFGKIMTSLCNQYIFELKNSNDSECLEMIGLIEFTFREFKQIIEKIDFSKNMRLQVSDLLSAVCQMHVTELFLCKHAGSALMLSNDLLERNKKLGPDSQVEDYKCIDNFSSFFVKISDHLLNSGQDDVNQVFSLSSKIIIGLQKQQSYNEIPQWLISHTDCLHSPNYSILLVSIEALMGILVSDLPQMNQLKQYLLEQDRKHIKLLLNNLWQLLDYHFTQSRNIDFIIIFQREFHQVFKDQVELGFDTGDIALLTTQIKRYTSFFRMTNDFYIKNSLQNDGVGVSQMVNLLQHTNPLIKQTVKSWLTESSHYLSRILDPILENFIRVKNYYVSDSQQIIYTSQYDIEGVQKGVIMLRFIINYLNQTFINYIFEEKISLKIKANFNEDCSYLQLIVTLLLRFIQGQGLESLGKDFSEENQLVNGNCCELFEQLSNIMESREVVHQSLGKGFKPCLMILRQLVQNQDQIMQIQLLNLLEIMIKQLKESIPQQFSVVLQSDLFFENLLIGLKQSNVFYVRSRFLSIITVAIFMLSDQIDEQILKQKVQLVLKTYLSALIELEIHEEEDNLGDSNLQTFRRSLSYYEISDAQSKTLTSQSNFNEILNICEAIKAILNFYLKFREETVQDNQNSSWLMDILTLRMITRSQDKQKFQTFQFNQYKETNQMILGLLPQIIRTYLHCWKLSSNFENHQFFSKKGIILYKYEQFQLFNKNLQEQLAKKLSEISHKRHILEVMRPISQQFPREFVNAVLVIWMEQSENDLMENYDEEYNQIMFKLIELLVTLNISGENLMTALIESTTINDIIQNQKQTKRKNYNYYDEHLAQKENKTLFFVYTFLSYTLLDKKCVERENLSSFWKVCLQFLEIFLNSKTPSTVNWTLEILFLLSRKFSPKEIMGGKEFRKDVHRYVKSQLDSLASIGARKYLYTTFLEEKDIDQQKFKLLSPLTPSIYEIYQNCRKFLRQNPQNSRESTFEVEKFIFSPSHFFPEEDQLRAKDFINRQSLISLKTIKKISQELLQNIYDQNERVEISKELILVLLPMLEKRNVLNRIFVEGISEIILTFFERSTDYLVNDMKKHIIEYFMMNDFFKCSKLTLKYWTTIIDLTSDTTDLMTSLMYSSQGIGDMFTDLFTSKASETQQRIKNLERICFLIYSGSIDKYKNKLKQLIQSMMEVIKDPDQAHPAILILVLFCVRILILRLSQQTLTDLFKDLWPILLTLLIEIFDKGRPKQIELIAAALKLIELISIMQIDEFQLHQWIFVFDYFGITLEPIEMKGKDQATDNPKVITPFQYIPLMSYHFPSTYQLTYQSHQQDQIDLTYQMKKRQFILKEAYLETEFDLSNKVKEFTKYMIDINQQRLVVDRQSIESVVQDDFKQLDEYIFQFKIE